MLDAGYATLDYLKSRLLPDAGQDEMQWDAQLERLGLSVAGMLQRHCNRVFPHASGLAERYSARTLAVCLKQYPVTAVTSLALVDPDGTQSTLNDGHGLLDPASGVIEFSAPPGSSNQRLQINYAGGYWLDPMDGTTTLPDGQTALPDEILEAWIAQCQATAAARGLFGAASLADPKNPRPSGEMTAEVEAMLRPHRRFSGE